MHLIRTILFRIDNQQAAPRGTTGVRLICTLTEHHDENCLSVLTIRPRFVGLAARPRAATLPINSCPQLCIWQSWRPLRSSSGDCGARAGGTGSAGCAGRRRIRRAGARLLFGSDKAGARTPDPDHMPLTQRQVTVLTAAVEATLESTASIHAARNQYGPRESTSA